MCLMARTELSLLIQNVQGRSLAHSSQVESEHDTFCSVKSFISIYMPKAGWFQESYGMNAVLFLKISPDLYASVRYTSVIVSV